MKKLNMHVVSVYIIILTEDYTNPAPDRLQDLLFVILVQG